MTQITVRDIPVDVVRKDIKNLHLAVYPPSGRVRIAAPLRVNDDAVRLFVVSKLGWIKRQQAKFQQQDRQPPRAYVSGESHWVLGRRYRLRVVNSAGAIRLKLRNNTTLELIAPELSSVEAREHAMLEWYRQTLKELIPALIEKWSAIIGVDAPLWGVKRMKTKWGTCNIAERRIWLNLELAKKPIHCLEYVIAHELTHLLERRHSERFRALMDRHIPNWRLFKSELNALALSHPIWEDAPQI